MREEVEIYCKGKSNCDSTAAGGAPALHRRFAVTDLELVLSGGLLYY